MGRRRNPLTGKADAPACALRLAHR